MPDSECLDAERVMQPMFTKPSLFNSLALATGIVGAQAALRANPPPLDVSPAVVSAHWQKITLRAGDPIDARLAGAWVLHADDPRVGGFSALAIHRGRLLAVSDSGMIVRLPFPGRRGAASLRALPAVAGNPGTKVGRDSEAVAHAPGRGWWIAFEQRHQLILFDEDFRRERERVALRDSRLRPNRGVEAIALDRVGRPKAFLEQAGISDAATLPDGRIVLLRRRISPLGFEAAIAGLGRSELALPTGRLDNAEGLTVQPLTGGAMRLWVVTDNDNRRWRRTLLVALDVPARAPKN